MSNDTIEFLDKLEARAVEAIVHTYDVRDGDINERFWIQKGIEGMRLAVAENMDQMNKTAPWEDYLKDYYPTKEDAEAVYGYVLTDGHADAARARLRGFIITLLQHNGIWETLPDVESLPCVKCGKDLSWAKCYWCNKHA